LFQEIKKPVTHFSRDESMYTDYFHLREQPFSLTPDPRYLFMSERHREGLAHLLYGVQQQGGFVQLTGDIGSGKTTLSRCLVRQLPPETDVALILNPRLTAIELLASVCDELRISYPADTASIKVLIDALNAHLLEAHAQRRRTVLIIDEAQNLHSDVLEQIRLLTNLETSREKLLQIILIGQPELLSMLQRKRLRQLAQRITARYHLLPLSRRETYAYIRHRLFVAGRRDPLFTGSAMRCVYRLSGGVPRSINIICDRALLGAYAMDKRRVTVGIVRRASRETSGIIPWYRKFRPVWIAGFAALIALMAGGALFFNAANLLPARKNASAVQPTRNPTAPPPLPARKVEKSPGPAEAQPKLNTVAKSQPPAKEPASSTAAAAIPGMRFTDLVSQSRGSLSSNLSDLFVRWQIKASMIPAELNCTNVREQGFECLSLVGGWHKLRRYGVPASLEIVLQDGTRKHATIVGLNNEKATFVIGGREYAFPIAEVDKVWHGSFVVLWKPPFASRQIEPGTRSEGVVWLRRALDAIDKKPPSAAVSDLYDDELQKRILAFQQHQLLIQDGLIGSETLVRLTLAFEGRNAPSLSGANR
jgi:general secretion pathway protein A